MDFTRTTRLIFPFILSFSLVACGGGFSADTSSNPNTGGGGDNTGDGISTLRLITSSYLLQSASASSITLSAIAKDENNVLLDNADIQISVDNGADLTATTGASVKIATLTPGVPDNRVLTVLATVGNRTETLEIEVFGTTLTLDGPASITINKPATYKVKVKDSANAPVGNRTILLPTVTAPCTITQAANPSLNSAGEFEFLITGSVAGNCILESGNFGANATLDIGVSGDEFTITPTTDKANDVLNGDDEVIEIPVGSNETINLSLKQDNIPVSGETIQLSSTRGSIPTSVDTDENGEASFEVTSLNTGNVAITASVNGLNAIIRNIEFIADTPTYILSQASPSIVRPLGKSIITTTIQDIDNNPVKNKFILFNLSSDTVGGVLSNSIAKTDSLGRASVEYTAGNRASETDGVVITSEVQGDETITQFTTLTVGGDAVRIVLGTNSILKTTDLTYTQQFIVTVTDSAGNPVSDQHIDFSLVPTAFYKGKMIAVDTDGDLESDTWTSLGLSLPVSSNPSYVQPKRCISEDQNNNNNLDLGEDLDNDEALEPTHDASVSAVSGSTTGTDGSVILDVTYPKSSALWSEQKLIVRTSLDGSEYEESTQFKLSVAAGDVSDITKAPPSNESPYGKYVDCNIPN